MGGDVAGGVAVVGVPADDQGVGGQSEGDGAFDGAGGAVAGLADAEDLAHLGKDHFDGPPGGVAVDDLFGRGGQVGRDEGEVVVLAGVAQQDQSDGQVFPRSVPLHLSFGQAHGRGLSVAVHGDCVPGGASGDLGQ